MLLTQAEPPLPHDFHVFSDLSACVWPAVDYAATKATIDELRKIVGPESPPETSAGQ